MLDKKIERRVLKAAAWDGVCASVPETFLSRTVEQWTLQASTRSKSAHQSFLSREIDEALRRMPVCAALYLAGPSRGEPLRIQAIYFLNKSRRPFSIEPLGSQLNLQSRQGFEGTSWPTFQTLAALPELLSSYLISASVTCVPSGIVPVALASVL